jgi:hypothetical protein
VLTAYAIWRPFAPDGLGDLHRARVIARVPALAGSFVALAGAEAFLPDSACEVPVTQGQMLTVRVVRSAQSGKGPRVSARACPESQGDSEGDVRHLAPGPTVLQRLAAAAQQRDPALARAGLHADFVHDVRRWGRCTARMCARHAAPPAPPPSCRTYRTR